MGKCKKRTLTNRQNGKFSEFSSTRQEALDAVIKLLSFKENNSNKKIQKKQQNYKQIVSMVSLFGITAEELSEAGVCYEDLLGLGSLI